MKSTFININMVQFNQWCFALTSYTLNIKIKNKFVVCYLNNYFLDLAVAKSLQSTRMVTDDADDDELRVELLVELRVELLVELHVELLVELCVELLVELRVELLV